jgi:hypothetical protein
MEQARIVAECHLAPAGDGLVHTAYANVDASKIAKVAVVETWKYATPLVAAVKDAKLRDAMESRTHMADATKYGKE